LKSFDFDCTIVFKENDDLMSATRYGIMMLRFAEPEKVSDRHRRRPVSESSWMTM
jgi:hypothetical protein